MIHFRALLACLVYLACAVDPSANTSILGLIYIRSRYFPYVLPAIDIISGAGILTAGSTFTGIIVGHLWWMLEFVLAGEDGSRLGQAPTWMTLIVGPGAEGVVPDAPNRGYGSASAPRGRNIGGGGTGSATVITNGHKWGTGSRLSLAPACGSCSNR
jgi:Derlin-2/3